MTNSKVHPSKSPSTTQDEIDLSQTDLAPEFHAWDVASDEALENFEEGLAISPQSRRDEMIVTTRCISSPIPKG